MDRAGGILDFLDLGSLCSVVEIHAAPGPVRVELLKAVLTLFHLAESIEMRPYLQQIISSPSLALPPGLLLGAVYMTHLFQGQGVLSSMQYPQKLRFPYHNILSSLGAKTLGDTISELRRVFSTPGVFDHFLLKSREHAKLCQRLIDEIEREDPRSLLDLQRSPPKISPRVAAPQQQLQSPTSVQPFHQTPVNRPSTGAVVKDKGGEGDPSKVAAPLVQRNLARRRLIPPSGPVGQAIAPQSSAQAPDQLSTSTLPHQPTFRQLPPEALIRNSEEAGQGRIGVNQSIHPSTHHEQRPCPEPHSDHQNNSGLDFRVPHQPPPVSNQRRSSGAQQVLVMDTVPPPRLSPCSHIQEQMNFPPQLDSFDPAPPQQYSFNAYADLMYDSNGPF